MQYFSNRLKSARKMNGFSLQDLSDKLNGRVSKQDLNRLELGQMLPDSEILFLLTNTLGVTSDYFFREHILDLEQVEFRKLTKLPKKDQEAVKAKTVDFLERYLELENLMGIESPSKFPFQGYTLEENTPEHIESAAIAFRQSLALGTDPIFNVLELLEENGIKIFSTIADPAFSGMSTLVGNSVMVIVYNDHKDIPKVRKRFTILHEVAHLFLGLSKFNDKEKEKICDSFAGAVLLPKQKVLEYFGGKRKNIFTRELMSIKSYFGISIPAIMYRAKSHDIVSDNYLKYFMIRYNKEYKSLETKGYDGIEFSQRFIQLLMRAVAEEVVSTSKAASLNNQKLWEFRKQHIDSVII